MNVTVSQPKRRRLHIKANIYLGQHRDVVIVFWAGCVLIIPGKH
jgi:hypothetical protein